MEVADPAPAQDEVIPEAPDAINAWSQWSSAPTPQNLNKVLGSVSPVIQSTVARYPGLNENLLRGEAKRLAVSAIKSYRPDAGSSLSTHVFNHLRPLSRFADRQTKAVTVPRDLRAETAAFNRAKKDFYETNGREPFDSELQDILGINQKRLQKLNQASFYEFAEGQVEDSIGIEDEDSAKLNLWTDYVYHDLSPRDKQIMDLRIGRSGKPPLEPEQIAKLLSIDPSYVRKRAKIISSKILEGLNQT